MRIWKSKTIRELRESVMEQLRLFAAGDSWLPWKKIPADIQKDAVVESEGSRYAWGEFAKKQFIFDFDGHKAIRGDRAYSRIKIDIKRSQALLVFINNQLKELRVAIEKSEDEPIPFPVFWDFSEEENTSIWLFKQDVYMVGRSKQEARYNIEETQLLILQYYDKERQKFEGLKRRYKSEEIQKEAYHRDRIPEEVRIAVWRRDDGKCARCGSREKLEYDHIVPVSKGGSNTARNIELLCETCNRKKSNNIE